MMRAFSSTFRSVKPPIRNPKLSNLSSPSSSSSSPTPVGKAELNSSFKSKPRPWCVYLILSTNPPIKTYVGATTNFIRRLKQHNGDLKGGAKASRTGRPWICACIVRGFTDQSEACAFESKWKDFSRRVPRKKNNNPTKQIDDPSLPLLQHRQAALSKVKGSLECNHLKIKWHLNPL